MFGYLVNYTKDLFDYDAPTPIQKEIVQWILQRDSKNQNEKLYDSLMEIQKNSQTFTVQGETIHLKNDFKSELSQQSIKLLQISMSTMKQNIQEDEEKFIDIMNEITKMGLIENSNPISLYQNEIAIIHSIYRRNKQKQLDFNDQTKVRENTMIEYQVSIESKLSENCLKHYQVYGQSMDTFEDINSIVDRECSNIHELRKSIMKSRSTVLQKGLQIQSKQRKITRMKILIYNQAQYTLEKLQVLKSTFGQLAEKMSDFNTQSEAIGAYIIIPLIKATQENIQKYCVFQQNIFKQLKDLNLACIKNSENFLDSKIEFIKVRVQSGIQSCLLNFDEAKYFSYLQSYFYLQKYYGMEEFQQQLWSGMKNAIKTAFMKGYTQYEIQSKINYNINETNNKKLNTEQRISQIDKDHLQQFFKIMYREIVELLINFYLCNRFHQNYLLHLDEQNQQDNNCLIDKEYIDLNQFNEFLDKISQQYLSLRQQIWTQIQKKLIKIIHQRQVLNTLPFDQFIKIIGYTCLLIKRAEVFSQGCSKMICSTLEHRIMEYFNTIHKQNINILMTYISNEEFRRLPVANQNKSFTWFNYLQKIKQHVNQPIFQYISNDRNDSQELNTEIKIHHAFQNLFENEQETQQFYLFGYQNPFSLPEEEFKLVQDALWLSPDQNFQSEDKDFETCFTSTSLKLFQIIPIYFNLIFYAPSLSLNIFKKLIYYSFKILVTPTFKQQLDENFALLLKYDENKDIETFFTQYDAFSDSLIIQEKYKILKKFCNDTIIQEADVNDVDIFYRDRPPFQDIAERAMAIESIFFLLQWVKKALVLVLPVEDSYFTEELQVLDEVMAAVSMGLYRSYMQQHIKIDGITSSIMLAKWDIRESNSLQNPYVDRLIRFICDQKDKLKSLGGGAIPANGQREIFENFIEYCLNLLLESYGKVKKITLQGREQMLQEFKLVFKTVQKNNNNVKMPNSLDSLGEKFLTVFNQPMEEVWDFVIENKNQLPYRLLANLYCNCVAFHNLKRQQKKDDVNRIYKLYFDTFNSLKS